MYTGRTERPCCLCGDPETRTRVDVPPRAIQLMLHSDPVAWRDVVGEVSLHFCESDWDLVADLVCDVGVLPLSRCNVAYASFSVREDFEALLNETRPEPDQTELEVRLLASADDVLAAHADGEDVERRALVEARIVRMSLSELGVADARERPARADD